MKGHPVLWIILAGVLAPMLSQLQKRFKLPVVVLEIMLGIIIGPHVLGFLQFSDFLAIMFTLGMAATLFMAGMELEFDKKSVHPMSLGARSWGISLLLSFIAVVLLHFIPQVQAPMMVTLALCTTGLGVLIPILRDGGQLKTNFGHLITAAGTIGEVGPIVGMSLMLAKQYSTWQELGFLLAFIAIVGLAIFVGLSARPPRLILYLSKEMTSSTQLPVRITLLILATFFVLAQEFGFEAILGAFAAGMVVGMATRGENGKPFREKINAVFFGWFYPFFFVGTGVKFDISALGQNLTTMLLVPTFLFLFLFIRGIPVFLYRNEILREQRLAFALSLAVPSLSLIVVITNIGLQAKVMNTDIATALIGAAILSVLLFPTFAGVLMSRRERLTGII